MSGLLMVKYTFTICDYEILRAESAASLASLVRSRLRSGWRTEGRAFITSECGRIFYHQTMIRTSTGLAI